MTRSASLGSDRSVPKLRTISTTKSLEGEVGQAEVGCVFRVEDGLINPTGSVADLSDGVVD